MVYGYIRVSSDKQTVENQRFEISNFAKNHNLHVDGWIEETISGVKNYDKRELGKLLKKVKKDDLIICAELSRLGRNLFMIMEILNLCMSRECKVWTIKDNYRLGEDIQSKVLAFAFGLSAEIAAALAVMGFASIPLHACAISAVTGVLRAGGDVMWSTVLDIAPQWVVCLPATALAALVFKLGCWPIAFAIQLESIVKFPLCLWRVRGGKWVNDVTGGGRA